MKNKLLIFLGICLFFLVVLVFLFLIIHTKKHSPKKLVFWSIQLKPVYEKQINKIISDFETQHSDYKVIWVDIPIQEAQKRTLASILSSTPPDLVNLNPDFSVLLAQRNVLYTFNQKDVETYVPALVEKLKYNGKIYALPYYVTSPVTIYNKELYKNCIGGDFIKSYTDLEKISDKLKKCSNASVFSGSINENDTFAKILNKYNVFDLTSEYQKEKATEVYSLFNKLYKNKNLPEDILAINHRENIEKYMSNQTMIVVAGSNFVNMIKQNSPVIYSKSELANQLVGDNGKYDVSIMNLIIPKKSKNIEAAKEFAKLLTNKENQIDFAKVTNVLPANHEALNDAYFKNCSSDLYQKSRCIGASQLNNLVQKDFGDKNKKAINETLNKSLEEMLLDKACSKKQIKEKVGMLSKEIKILQEN